MPLPEKIEICPIVEAVFETRFQTDTPEDALSGVVYHILKKSLPKMTTLPLANLPAQFRKRDPEFRFSPMSSLDGDALGALVGPTNVAFLMKGTYPGWSTFSLQVLDHLLQLDKEGLFKSLTRFGLRYINFFEGDVLPNLELSLKVAGSEQHGDQTFFKTVLAREEFKCLLQVGRDLELSNRAGQKGTIIDIDVSQDFASVSAEDIATQAERFLEAAHKVEKDLFFSLLKPAFLESLKPVYK